MRGCFDTSILIDYLRGVGGAEYTISSYDDRSISIVTVIEVMAGAPTDKHAELARATIRRFEVVQLEADIAEIAITIRQQTRLRLPDAIILATARHQQCPLVTRNTKDFRDGDPEIVIPYLL